MTADRTQIDQPLPDDLKMVLGDLEAADREARQLVESLDDAQLNWQPESGIAWSVAQCLDHLAQGNALYAAALREAIYSAGARSRRGGPIHPGWFGRWFIRAMEAPPRWKFNAPKKIIPAARKSGREVLKAFLIAHDAVRSLIYDVADVDLNKIRFRNPFVPLLRFTVGTGLLVISAHDRRHLWQARQVRAAMKQPTASRASRP